MKPTDRLNLAREQLAKVQVAWLHPIDWADLTIYGMHALENAVKAAADHCNWEVKKNHPAKAEIARRLHDEHRLPDIAELLEELNELRKGIAYGEPGVEPTMSAENIAASVESYIDAATEFLDDAEAL